MFDSTNDAWYTHAKDSGDLHVTTHVFMVLVQVFSIVEFGKLNDAHHRKAHGQSTTDEARFHKLPPHEQAPEAEDESKGHPGLPSSLFITDSAQVARFACPHNVPVNPNPGGGGHVQAQ